MSSKNLTVYIEKKDSDFYLTLLSDIEKNFEVETKVFSEFTELDSLSPDSRNVLFFWQDQKFSEKQKFLFERFPNLPSILVFENSIPKENLSHPTQLNLSRDFYSFELLSITLNFAERLILDQKRASELEEIKERMAVLENVFEESLDILIQIDPQSKEIIGINKQALNVLNYKEGDLKGKDFSILLPKVASDEAEFQGSLIEGGSLITKDDKLISTESSFRLYPVNGKMVIWATFRDISERKKAQEQVKRQKAFYEFILDNIDSDISVLGDDFKYEYSNPVLVPNIEIRSWLYGKTDAELSKRLNLLPGFAEKRQKFLSVALNKNDIVQFEELLPDEQDGKKYLLRKYIPIEDPDSKTRKVISYGIEITERKLAEERISYLAYYDSLTGLSNRTLFIDHTNQAIKNHKSTETLIACYFFDIDNFKFINDSLGHAKGDMLLQMVAARLKRIMTEVDTVARFGGDEFAILKVDILNRGQASEFASRVLDILSQPFHVMGRDLYTTISMGIALSPNDGITTQELLKNADMAMYKAKEVGRNNFRFYTNELILRSEKRLYIESSLRKALQNNELSLFFQPQISMKSNRVCGAEALIRWRHPERGWVPPIEFIPVAEDSGLIERIGDWVLEEACRLKKSWCDDNINGFNVSINVSGKQLKRNNWAHKVHATLEHFKINAHEIELELTESSIMENPEKSIEAFRYLSDLGVKVSIDDFGTGYSSLSYLKKINADILKIDRSFVIDLDKNEDDQAICRAIINMAVSLGMEVIAEGVETEVQRNILKNFGCHIIQGYFYSKPLPAEDFISYVKKINH
ncbi:sensor domain-containing protein [Leptospira ilyithenensis]|uniref:EAL domain-containing protein n=1 Tax=Leptospira ilyithenensis TaxID=2484901 RepID=A0A4R9LR12_9LEPT|nr:EAL domain-containing protein [Leptospira ilyithenensis]TGN10933.1 EAL domain-containing protein [Leptospira ilyithenensis]